MTIRTGVAALLAAAGVTAGVLLAAAGPNAEAAQPPGPAAEGDGVASCVSCHSGSSFPNMRKFVDDYKSNEFVRLDESVTWETHDPHSRAYEVLDPAKNDIAKRMQAVLGYDIRKATQCLTCHAVDTAPASPTKSLEQFRVDQKYNIGVGCTACHGIGAWQTTHFVENAGAMVFREKLPADKQKVGLTNLRDAGTKAKVCATCHVGSADETKTVTHAMYAAGHPALPPLEVVTFSNNQPQHWNYPDQLPYLKTLADTDPAKAWKTFRVRAKTAEVSQARHVAAGAVASLRAEMTLLAADAKAAAGTDDFTTDFARFDCYACHHDLKIPSDRQLRGYDGHPGRPPVKYWVKTLPGVVAAHAATLKIDSVAAAAAGFDAKWLAVSKAATLKPFGDPKAVQVAAGDMAAWCDNFLSVIEAHDGPVYTPEATKSLLAAVSAKLGDGAKPVDAEAAMHLFWGYRQLREVVSGDKAKFDPLGKFLPLGVREPIDRTGKAPVTAGKVWPARQKLFSDYLAGEFVPAFRKLAGD